MNNVRTAPSVDYGQFETEEHFLRWVETNQGFEASKNMKSKIEEELKAGRSVDAPNLVFETFLRPQQRSSADMFRRWLKFAL